MQLPSNLNGIRIMTLKTKWIDILYNVATGSRNIRNFFTPIGAIFYGLLIFVFAVIALYVDRLIFMKWQLRNRRIAVIYVAAAQVVLALLLTRRCP